MEPAVAIPILVALVALLGLSLLDEPPRAAVRRVIRRANGRNATVDSLDVELAAVGVDVARFEQMSDLDLALFSVGVDVALFDGLARTVLGVTSEPVPTG